MTRKKDWFSNLDEQFSQIVRLGNDMTMLVVSKGSIKVQVESITQVLSDVYYIPKLKNDLLSIGKLQEKGLAILFQNGTCKVYHLQKRLNMQTDTNKNRMFLLPLTPSTENRVCLQVESAI